MDWQQDGQSSSHLPYVESYPTNARDASTEGHPGLPEQDWGCFQEDSSWKSEVKVDKETSSFQTHRTFNVSHCAIYVACITVLRGLSCYKYSNCSRVFFMSFQWYPSIVETV